MKIFLVAITLTISFIVSAQPDRWQQRVKYAMDIDMNVETNRFTGKQKLEYWNNSPDTLHRVFYHLYFNAFQPGSMMDTRSRRQGTIVFRKDRNGNDVADWDDRVKDRILNLKPDEIGYQKIVSLKMNGRPQAFKVLETILEVRLDKPILPKSKVVFDMEFEAQVPIQIRRSGRDNPKTTVRYSMSQWYPKICEYDYEGWHPTPYVGREFYGVWGDFSVNITIDKKYILGGTGYLQNANQIGYGYETPGTKVVQPAGNKLTWKFFAPNVHDFMWAADPDYKHISQKVRDSLTIHVLYKTSNTTDADWQGVLANAVKALPFIEKTFGPYPYKQYSFIHGGDGGMEYPMATLLFNKGAWLHEWMHSWYYGLLGTNESLYAWMDEGFTDYADARVQAFLDNSEEWPYKGSYAAYYNLVRSNKEEPLTTHADHFNTNFAYSNAAYSKGTVFLEQLGYITSAQLRDKILLEYYWKWRFKHPNATDFIRIAEKVSDMKLDWYKEYFVNTTKTIDYSIDSLWAEDGKTKVRIKRIGLMPMPIDLQMTFKDGSKEMHYVPLDLMYGEKPAEDPSIPRKIYDAWKWTNDTYVVETEKKLTDITTVEIDPSQRMADIDRRNNKLELKW
ncbi:MAG: M1 family metallopeptidase [Bacteroidetes bacterium]|nr:M1 family metallopeptidase [Bacteroidota bacterium]